MGGALAAGGVGTFKVSGGTAILLESNLPAHMFTAGSSIQVSGGSLSIHNLDIKAGSLSHTGGTFSAGIIWSSGDLRFDAAATVNSIFLEGGTLSGHGSVSGAVAGETAAHTIAPSLGLAPTATGTLSVGALTTIDKTVLRLNLVDPASGANDRISVSRSNGLTLNGGKIEVANTPDTLASLGYYKIIGYSGSIQGGGISSITAPADDGDYVYSLTTSHDPGFVDLHKGMRGDTDDDGVVNFADFVALSNNFGKSDTGWQGADFHGDGITNFADFVVLSNNYGHSIDGSNIVATPDEMAALQAFASAVAPVPEPLTAGLLGLGLTTLLLRRKRR